jgi:hypothetical protein
MQNSIIYNFSEINATKAGEFAETAINEYQTGHNPNNGFYWYPFESGQDEAVRVEIEPNQSGGFIALIECVPYMGY